MGEGSVRARRGPSNRRELLLKPVARAFSLHGVHLKVTGGALIKD